MKSPFGSGWVLGGRHSSIKDPEVQFSLEADIWRTAQSIKREVKGPRQVAHLAKLSKPPVDIDVEFLPECSLILVLPTSGGDNVKGDQEKSGTD